MTVRTALAALLADHIGGTDVLDLEGATVGEALHDLTTRYPVFAPLVWTPQGAFGEQLAVFLNRRNIHTLEGLESLLRPGDEMMLISAVEESG